MSILDQIRRKYVSDMLENEERKDKFLADPTNTDKVLSHFTRPIMTDKMAAKLPTGANFEKAISVVDKEDPRRQVLEQLQKDMPTIIKNSAWGESPGNVILKELDNRNKAVRESTYKFIRSRQGFFDKEVAPEQGYEDWERSNPGFTSPVSSFLFGAGAQVASEALTSRAATALPFVGRAAGAIGRLLSFAPPVGAGLPARILGAGLMTIPAILAADATRKAVVKSGYKLSEEPIPRLLEEVVMGAPGFMGTMKLVGMGASRFAGATARMKANLNIFDDAAVSSAATKGTTREEVLGAAKREADEAAMNAYKEAKMRSYEKLEPEDIDAIARGADKNDILKKRVAANMEKEALETKANFEKLQTDIETEAKSLMSLDNSLDYASARELSRRRLAPTQIETADDFAYLRDRLPESILSKMSPQQAAVNRLNWEKHGVKTRDLVVRDEVLPPAVQAGKYAPTSTLKLHEGTPSVIQAGMPDQALLPASGEGALTKTEQQIAARKAEALGKLRTARIGEHEYKPYAEELAGNEGFIKEANLRNRVTGYINTAAKEMFTLKQKGEEILSSSMSATEKQAALNKLTTDAYDNIGKIVNYFGFQGSQREQMLRAAFSKLTRGFKGVDDALEGVAKDEMTALTAPMASTNTPVGNRTVGQATAATERLRKEGIKLYKKQFGNTPLKDVIKDPTKVQQALDWIFKYKPLFMGAAGAGALVSASSLFADPADAAGFDKVAFLKSTVDALRASGKPVEKQVARLVEAGHHGPILSEDGTAVQHIMKGHSYAPSDVGVFPRTRSMNLLDRILSPHTRGEIHFDARDANGNRLPYNAAVEMGDRSQVIAANAETGLSAVSNIMKEAGAERALDDITNMTLPLVQKYHSAVNLQSPYYQGRMQMLDDVLQGKYRSEADSRLTGLSKQIKAAGKDISKLDPEDQVMYRLIEAEKAKMADAYAQLAPTLKEFEAEWTATMRQVASKHSTARIALAVDGTGMDAADPWLANMLSDSEKVAVKKIKAVNDMYGVRMQETGHDIISGPYMHHPAHPSVDYGESLKELGKFAPDADNAMRLVNFFHRSAGSKLMIPDTHYIMAKYLPDAAKRIEISDFWKVGKQNGWDAVRKQMQARGGYEGGLKLLDDLRTAFDPMDVSGSAKWLNRYAAFEVARLLTLSPSVSFKHALKLMGNWTIFPSKVSAEATAENVGLFSRQIAQDLAGDTFKGKDMVADLGRAFTNQSHMYAAVSDMAPYDLPVSAFDKFLTKWNQAGSTAVRGVERWDRGQTFLSAMMMAQKKGMTPEQARYALMDTVMKVNFLTGPNNPKWLKDPFIRTMMLFQGTPFKILEQRAMMSYQAGKDISQTLKLLGQLRQDVKTGEERLIWNLLKDELTRSKDIYGTPYTNQFLKQLMVLGTVIYGGKHVFDSDLWGHAVHFPGVQLGERGVQLGLNPLIGAAYKTGRQIAAGKDEDEFFMSKFFNNWFTNIGFPAVAHKMARLKNDDIPAIYRENKLNYLFGVPKTKEQ